MENFLDIDVLKKITKASGRNAKIELLKNLEQGKELLALALDPNVTFGVTADEWEYDELYREFVNENTSARVLLEQFFWNEVYSLLLSLKNREKTGNEANEAVKALVRSAPSQMHVGWLCRLINKDLRIGIQLSSLLKVWPNIVEKFEVQLAVPYDASKHFLDAQWWFVEPKLDGLRMVVIDGIPYTRNGKVLSSVNHIIDRLKSVLDIEQYVFDGEVMGGGLFDEASGKVRKKDVQALEAVYHIFDVIPIEQWHSKKSIPLFERKNLLLSLSPLLTTTKEIKVVEHYLSNSLTPASIKAELKKYIEQGYEGIMLKQYDKPYQFKRSRHLLKVKEFHTEDCEVIELIEGKGKYKGMLGACIVRTEAGATCEVGSGFTDEERKKFWRDFLLTDIIEVQYQEKTSDGKLRFPVFVRRRPDKN